MDEAALTEALEQWDQVTILEGSGIRESNWALVTSCQERKESLRAQINAAWPSGAVSASLQATASKLIGVEQKHLELLQQHLTAAASRNAQLLATSSNLRKIKHSYGSQPRANWTSYS